MATKIVDRAGVTMTVVTSGARRMGGYDIVKTIRLTDNNGQGLEIELTEEDVEVLETRLRA